MHELDLGCTLNNDRRVSVLTDAPISFGTIPREHWAQPEWIDEERAQEARRRMGSDRMHFIPYGGTPQLSKHPTLSSTSDIYGIREPRVSHSNYSVHDQ